MDSALARYDSHQDDEEEASESKSSTSSRPSAQPALASPVDNHAETLESQNTSPASPASPSTAKTVPVSRGISPLLSLPSEIFTLILHYAISFPDLPSLFTDIKSRDQLAERIRQHTSPVGDLQRRNRNRTDTSPSASQPAAINVSTSSALLCNKALTRAVLTHLHKREWLFLAAPPAKTGTGRNGAYYPLESFVPLSTVRRAQNVEVHVDFSDLNRAMDWLEELFTIWEGGCAMQLLRVRVWSGDAAGRGSRGRRWGSEWALREDRRKVRKGMWTEIQNAGFNVPSYTESVQDGEAVDCKRRGVSLPVR